MPSTQPTNTATFEVDGAAVREKRMLAGVEMKELAEAAGVDRSYISQIELGRRTRVSPRVMKAIVDKLETTHDDLLATTAASA